MRRKGWELPKFPPLIWNSSGMPQSSNVRRDVRSNKNKKAFRRAWVGYEFFLEKIFLCGYIIFFDPEKW
jgi:hypothetical protein